MSIAFLSRSGIVPFGLRRTEICAPHPTPCVCTFAAPVGHARRSSSHIGRQVLQVECRAAEQIIKTDGYRTIVQGRNVKLTDALKSFTVSLSPLSTAIYECMSHAMGCDDSGCSCKLRRVMVFGMQGRSHLQWLP